LSSSPEVSLQWPFLTVLPLGPALRLCVLRQTSCDLWKKLFCGPPVPVSTGGCFSPYARTLLTIIQRNSTHFPFINRRPRKVSTTLRTFRIRFFYRQECSCSILRPPIPKLFQLHNSFTKPEKSPANLFPAGFFLFVAPQKESPPRLDDVIAWLCETWWRFSLDFGWPSTSPDSLDTRPICLDVVSFSFSFPIFCFLFDQGIFPLLFQSFFCYSRSFESPLFWLVFPLTPHSLNKYFFLSHETVNMFLGGCFDVGIIYLGAQRRYNEE